MTRSLRLACVALLSLSLIYSPIFALPWPRPMLVQSPLKALLATTPALTVPHRPQELLVKFRAESTPEQRQRVRQSFSAAQQLLPTGIELFTLPDDLTTAQALAEVSKLERVVEWAEPNYWVNTEVLKTTAERSRQRKAKASRKRHAGQSAALIAVIDTGLERTHPALRRNLFVNRAETAANTDRDANGYLGDRYGWNFVRRQANVADDNGHGTQMAGVVLRANPRATLLPLKALDAHGVGTISAVVEAIDMPSGKAQASSSTASAPRATPKRCAPPFNAPNRRACSSSRRRATTRTT